MAMRASEVGSNVSMSWVEHSALAEGLAHRAEYRTFAAGRTLEAGPHFGQIEFKFGHGAAERVAMDAQLFSRLALVSPVCHQDFAQILPFKIAHGIFVTNAVGVHLRYQDVQF